MALNLDALKAVGESAYLLTTPLKDLNQQERLAALAVFDQYHNALRELQRDYVFKAASMAPLVMNKDTHFFDPYVSELSGKVITSHQQRVDDMAEKGVVDAREYGDGYFTRESTMNRESANERDE